MEDFTVTCPLVPGVPHLISGSCSSPRAFGLGFLQTPPHGGRPCPAPSLRLRDHLARGLAPRSFCAMPGTHAPGERRPTGIALRMRAEPALWAVRCSGVIMIEASPSAYLRGTAGAGNNAHSRQRRRPPALLHHAAPILLWDRPACPLHVCLPLESRGGTPGAPPHESGPGTLSQGRGSLAGGAGRRRRRSLHLVWARRSLCARRYTLRVGARPLYAGDSRRQSHTRQDRCAQECHAAPGWYAPAGVCLSRCAAGHAGSPPTPQAPDAHTRCTLIARPTDHEPV
jgi:hypothetical protein